jgi:hypothetical protein
MWKTIPASACDEEMVAIAAEEIRECAGGAEPPML